MDTVKLFVAIFFAIVGCTSDQSGIADNGKEHYPVFEVLLQDSTTVSTINVPKSEPVVFFCFGTYCQYSRVQMNDIVSNIDSLNGIQIFAVTISPIAELKDFCRNFNLDRYPNIKTGIDRIGYFPQHHKIDVVPYIAVYNANKILTGTHKGYISSSQIRNMAYAGEDNK